MFKNDEDSASSERLLHEGQASQHADELLERPTNRPTSSWWCNAGLVFQTILFVSSVTILFTSVKTHRDQCEDFMPEWSPALEAVKHTGYTHRFDGSFAKPNKFKGTPNPMIDASWDNVTYAGGGVISISEETLRGVNASVEYSVKLSPELGGGYMASVEVLHQLHCLNMLRQATYEDYYEDKAEPWTDSPQILRYHLDHCIDNLRQKLMCDADAGILTYVWVEGHPMPFPDFNVQHRCRDFSALQDWVGERQVYTAEGHGIVRMPDSKDLVSPP